MSEPSDEPITIATEDTFGSGTFASSLTKAALTASFLARGFFPKVKPPIDFLNAVLNNHGRWLSHLRSRDAEMLGFSFTNKVTPGNLGSDVKAIAWDAVRNAWIHAKDDDSSTSLQHAWPLGVAWIGANTTPPVPLDGSVGAFLATGSNGGIILCRGSTTSTPDDRVVGSLDGGETWTAYSIGSQTSIPFAIWDDSSTFLVFGEDQSQVFTTLGGAGAMVAVGARPTALNPPDVGAAKAGTVVVGKKGTRDLSRTSDGGASWTDSQLPASGDEIKGISWIERLSLWVVVGENSGSPLVWTSDDGETWTEETPTFVDFGGSTVVETFDLLTSVGGKVLVSVLYYSSGVGSVDGPCLAYSTDAITWTAFYDMSSTPSQIVGSDSQVAVLFPAVPAIEFLG